MKLKLLFVLLIATISNAQTQIGQDISGDIGDTTFGSATALSENGDVIAIASEDYSLNGTTNGLVRVYSKTSGNWTQIGQDILGPSNSRIGYRVAISNDGCVLAVSNYGSIIKVYKNVNNNWVQLGQDIPGYGHSISLSGDGTTIAIGDGDILKHTQTPVTIYKNISNNWKKIGEIPPTSSYFGFSVSLSENGDTVALSDYYPSGSLPGNAMISIFKYLNNNWIQVGNTITCNSSDSNIGWRISLSSDGSTLAVTANNTQVATQSYGSVYIYKNISNIWTQIGNPLTGSIPNETYGLNVAISGSGNVVIVGSRTNITTLEGKLDIFEYLQGSWVKKGQIKDSNGMIIWQTMSISKDGLNIAFRDSGNVSFIPKSSPNSNEAKGGASSVQVFNIVGLLSSDTFVLESFKVYPNPTTNVLNIELHNSLILEKVLIYNTTGQLVKETTEKIINVSTFAKGIYNVQVLTNQGKATKKVVVK